MLSIPYISAPKNACALACYTMTAKYFFPDTTFDFIGKLSNWQKGYVVWPFEFWKWIMDGGIKVTDYDLIDYEGWAREGIGALKKSLSDKEFTWLKNNSKDLDNLHVTIKDLLQHPNFTYYHKKASFNDLVNAYKKGSVCEVTLDSHALDRSEGFALHRVVVTNISEKSVTFHDPREVPKPNRVENLDHFINAWLGLEDPELCCYNK